MRVTVVCPEHMSEDANALAMVLSFGPDDGKTFGTLGWRDVAGIRYSVASFEASSSWLEAAQSELTRPVWDKESYLVNLAGARRCQDALLFWSPGNGDATPPNLSERLVVIEGLPGREAVGAVGLTDAETFF